MPSNVAADHGCKAIPDRKECHDSTISVSNCLTEVLSSVPTSPSSACDSTLKTPPRENEPNFGNASNGEDTSLSSEISVTQDAEVSSDQEVS